uniref:8.9 kDa family member n=1 Tax=Rhipicephalus appendiculatus TaxID=34631 RepID=A0A131YJA6_RHIAP
MKLATLMFLIVVCCAWRLVTAIITVPVGKNNTACLYFNETVSADGEKSFTSPCERVRCNLDATEVTVWGCPPPRNVWIYTSGGEYPRCCNKTG